MTFTASTTINGEPVEIKYEVSKTFAYTSWIDVFNVFEATIGGRQVNLNEADEELLSFLERTAEADFESKHRVNQ